MSEKKCVQFEIDDDCFFADGAAEWLSEIWELFKKVPTDRLRELAAAEREGRVAVLPCKVGDHIFTISTDGAGNIDSDEIREDTIYEFYIHEGGVGISIDPYDGHIGSYSHEGCDTGTRRIYLNKANAEAALAGKEDETHE